MLPLDSPSDLSITAAQGEEEMDPLWGTGPGIPRAEGGRRDESTIRDAPYLDDKRNGPCARRALKKLLLYCFNLFDRGGSPELSHSSWELVRPVFRHYGFGVGDRCPPAVPPLAFKWIGIPATTR